MWDVCHAAQNHDILVVGSKDGSNSNGVREFGLPGGLMESASAPEMLAGVSDGVNIKFPANVR